MAVVIVLTIPPRAVIHSRKSFSIESWEGTGEWLFRESSLTRVYNGRIFVWSECTSWFIWTFEPNEALELEGGEHENTNGKKRGWNDWALPKNGGKTSKETEYDELGKSSDRPLNLVYRGMMTNTRLFNGGKLLQYFMGSCLSSVFPMCWSKY